VRVVGVHPENQSGFPDGGRRICRQPKVAALAQGRIQGTGDGGHQVRHSSRSARHNNIALVYPNCQQRQLLVDPQISPLVATDHSVALRISFLRISQYVEAGWTLRDNLPWGRERDVLVLKTRRGCLGGRTARFGDVE
jgi:hypothetical protein